MTDSVRGGSNDQALPPIAADDVAGVFFQRFKLDLGTDGASAPVAGSVPTKDDYASGEVLADQAGANGVLTFTFASAVQMLLVESEGSVSRADPFGGTPTASLGIPLRDQVPAYLPVTTTTLRVYAPTGATLHVAGFRR